MIDETGDQEAGGSGADRITLIHGATLETVEASEPTGADTDTQAASSKHAVMLTNHGAALLYLYAHEDARIRDVANALRITERATARILADLRGSGHLRVTHANRRNRYEVTGLLPLHADDTHAGDTASPSLADVVLRTANLPTAAFIGRATVS